MIETHVPDRLLGVVLDEFTKRLGLKEVAFQAAHVHQADDDARHKAFTMTLRFEIQLLDKTYRNTTCHMSPEALLHSNVDAIMRRAGGMAATHLWRKLHAQT